MCPDYILPTHAHGDHYWGLPQALRDFPRVRILATRETAELGAWNLSDAIHVARKKKQTNWFDKDDVSRVNKRIRRVIAGERIQLGRDLFVTVVGAGHILGAVSYFFEYKDRTVFFTGDICLRRRGLIGPADDFRPEHCDVLVRDSTYAGVEPTTTYAEAEDALAAAVYRTCSRGGRAVVPAFAIDRMPQVALRLQRDPKLKKYPIFLIGGTEPTEVYAYYLPDASELKRMLRLVNPRSGEYQHLLRQQSPMIVVATSGMLSMGTPSYDWVSRLLNEPKSSVFFVGWQSPYSNGGEVLRLRDSPDLACEIGQFDLTGHMKEDEARELEARLNPGCVIHVHGEDQRIQAYIDRMQGKGPKRIKALVGTEIVL